MPLYVAGQKIRGSEINSLPQTSRVTSDQICNNSNTLRDAVGLSFQGEALVSYSVEIIMAYRALVTPQIKIAWSHPTGCTGWWGGQGVPGTSRIGTFDASCFVNDFLATFGLAGDSAFSMIAKPVAMVKYGATPGIFQFRFAQVTAHASDTAILTGSTLRATRLG